MSSDGAEKLYKNFGNFAKENFRSDYLIENDADL